MMVGKVGWRDGRRPNCIDNISLISINCLHLHTQFPLHYVIVKACRNYYYF